MTTTAKALGHEGANLRVSEPTDEGAGAGQRAEGDRSLVHDPEGTFSSFFSLGPHRVLSSMASDFVWRPWNKTSESMN